MGWGPQGPLRVGRSQSCETSRGYSKYRFTRRETTAHYKVAEAARCHRHHRGQDSQDAERGRLSLGLVSWFWKVLTPLLSVSGPCDCFLWREEAEGTACLPAADVDSFLLVDGGEGCLEASELISGKLRTFGIPRARCHEGLSRLWLRSAAGAAGGLTNPIPVRRAEPGGGSVPAYLAQLDWRDLGLRGHGHQLACLPGAQHPADWLLARSPRPCSPALPVHPQGWAGGHHRPSDVPRPHLHDSPEQQLCPQEPFLRRGGRRSAR